MEMNPDSVPEPLRVLVQSPTDAAEARRRVAVMAARLRFDTAGQGKVAIVVTEAATNLVKHGGGGELLARPITSRGVAGIEIIALDRGAGIPNLTSSLRDGFSTSGSPGTGLGAVARLAGFLDIHAPAGHGTALLARMWARPGAAHASGLSTGAVVVPHPKETVPGDVVAVIDRSPLSAGGALAPSAPPPEGAPDGDVALVVVDGLGHGVDAAEAAHTAVRVITAHPELPLEELVERAHGALRATRGAAIGIAEVDRSHRRVRFVGVGNIAGVVVTPCARERSMLSHGGTLGHHLIRVQVSDYPLADDSIVVMHSDGLFTRVTAADEPGLLEHDPSLIAAVLYRDFQRGNDDASVLVASGRSTSGLAAT